MDSDWDTSAEWSERRKAEFMAASRDPLFFEYELSVQLRPRTTVYMSVLVEHLDSFLDLSRVSWPHWDRIEAPFVSVIDISYIYQNTTVDITLIDYLYSGRCEGVDVVAAQTGGPSGTMENSLVALTLLTPLPQLRTERVFKHGSFRLEGELHPKLPDRALFLRDRPSAPRRVPVTISPWPLRKLVEPEAWDTVSQAPAVSRSSRVLSTILRNRG